MSLNSSNVREGNFVQNYPRLVVAGKVGAALTTAALAAVAITAFLHIGTFAQHAQLAQYVGIGTAAGGGVLAIGLVSFIIYSCKRHPAEERQAAAEERQAAAEERHPAAEESQPAAEEPQPAKKEESPEVKKSALCRLAGLLLLAKIESATNEEQGREYAEKFLKYFSGTNRLPFGEHHFGEDKISLYVSFSENLPKDVKRRMWSVFISMFQLLLLSIQKISDTTTRDNLLSFWIKVNWQKAALCTDEATHDNCEHLNVLVVRVRDKSFLFWGTNDLINLSVGEERLLEGFDQIVNCRLSG